MASCVALFPAYFVLYLSVTFGQINDNNNILFTIHELYLAFKASPELPQQAFLNRRLKLLLRHRFLK